MPEGFSTIRYVLGVPNIPGRRLFVRIPKFFPTLSFIVGRLVGPRWSCCFRNGLAKALIRKHSRCVVLERKIASEAVSAAYERRVAACPPVPPVPNAPTTVVARDPDPPPNGGPRPRPTHTAIEPAHTTFDHDAIVHRGAKWFEHTAGRWSTRGGAQRFVYDRVGRTTESLPDGRWRFRDSRILQRADMIRISRAL